MTSRTRVEIIDTVNKTKCAIERNKRLPEAKNACTTLNYPVQQGREKRTILSYAIPPGTKQYALLQPQLLKIHFYRESLYLGTYITRVRRPTLFPRVMHRTIFRKIHEIREAKILALILNDEDDTRACVS